MKTLNVNNRLPIMGYRYDDIFQALVTQEGVDHTAKIVGVGPDTVAHFVMHSFDIAIHYKRRPIATIYHGGNSAIIWGDDLERPIVTRLNLVLGPLGWRLLKVRHSKKSKGRWKLYHPATGSYSDFYDGSVVSERAL